ncbi:hypothetical protein [Geomonas azotofigens]|uniref:hypothetical protein n=1 Tax=Geomonas azotofigens TaxID=2843196 RepID=UPI001C1063A7|nr:hypothetical protein [Geomonas azotofigens]MBU5614524.1 hypothetical protein [Geomonas azotofigens]
MSSMGMVQRLRCGGKKGGGRVPAVAPSFVLALCLVVCWRDDARALSVFAVRDFYHSVGGGYNISNSKAVSRDFSSSQTTQESIEDYNAGFAYYLVSPLLLKGQSSFDLEWQQNGTNDELGDRKTSQFQVHYNIFGQLLPLSAMPAAFSAASSRQTISPPFSPSYQSETDIRTAHLSVQNKYVPASMSFTQQTQQTSGLAVNTRQSSDSLSFNAVPDLQEFGKITLAASLAKSDSSVLRGAAGGESRTGMVQAGYQGEWHTDAGLARHLTLNSSLQQTAGIYTLDSSSLNGFLGWQFGKKLDGSVSAFSSKNRSESASSDNRGVSAQLQQTLMGSLTTGVSVSATSEEFDRGSNNSYNAGLSFSYRKKLPEASAFSASYSYGKGLLERNGDVATVSVLNEQWTIPADLLRHITLAHPSFDPATLEVKGAQSLLTYPASYYKVVADGIELLNTFPGDTDVLISYSYRQDPGISTVSTSHGFNSALDLYGSKYRIYLNAHMSDTSLRKGDATGLTLTETRHVDTGATARLKRHTLSAETGYDKGYAGDVYYLSTSWRYGGPFAYGDLTLSAADRWSTLSSDSGASFWSNSATLQSSYRRAFGRLLGSFTANYANVLLQGGAMSHSTNLGANVEGKFGKLSAVLNSNLSWTYSGAGWSVGEGIGISLRRSF